MGFTSLSGGQAVQSEPGMGANQMGGNPGSAKSPDFGQRLGSYFQNKYPIAGGLAQSVFGNSNQQVAPTPQSAMAVAPLPMAQGPGVAAVDPSFVQANAQSRQGGGGLETLLKLFMG